MENTNDIQLKITDRNGVLHEVVAPTDLSLSLMEIIRSYEIAADGEIGVCGGIAMCASCQVYVQSGGENLREIQDDEDAMLGEALYVKENSRLGCQIPITKEIDGLEVEMAPYP